VAGTFEKYRSFPVSGQIGGGKASDLHEKPVQFRIPIGQIGRNGFSRLASSKDFSDSREH